MRTADRSSRCCCCCGCLYIKPNPYGRPQKYSQRTYTISISQNQLYIKWIKIWSASNSHQFKFVLLFQEKQIDREKHTESPAIRSPQKQFNGIKRRPMHCNAYMHRKHTAQMNNRHWIMSYVPRTNEITATNKKEQINKKLTHAKQRESELNTAVNTTALHACEYKSNAKAAS